MRITVSNTSDAEHDEIELEIESRDRLILGITAALDIAAARELYGKLGEALRKHGVLSDDDEDEDRG